MTPPEPFTKAVVLTRNRPERERSGLIRQGSPLLEDQNFSTMSAPMVKESFVWLAGLPPLELNGLLPV